MTFEAWLRKQTDRQDNVGQLAREFISYSDYVFKKHWKRVRCTTDALLTGTRGFLPEAQKEYLEYK